MSITNLFNRLFAYCKGGYFNIYIWVWSAISSGANFINEFTTCFVLNTSYEVRTLKIGFHQTIDFANFLLFVVYLRQIFRCRS